jgi:hypothetical protein
MYISNFDLTLPAFLGSIEANSEVPDGCDIEALVSQGLALCAGARCALTQAGRDRLRSHRTALQGDDRFAR